MFVAKIKTAILGCYIFVQILTVHDAAAAELISKKINDSFYVVLGGDGQGAHVGLSIGKDYLVLIDAMTVETSPKLLKVIRDISDKPIRYVINTHDHFDHSGGNAFFAQMGASIISHENAQFDSPLPLLNFDNKFSLSGITEKTEIFHVSSHSSTDAIIYLPESNVIMMGDVFANEWYPALFYGGISGQVSALDMALSIANDKTVIVPGHGYITDRQGIINYKENSISWVARIMALHHDGKSLEQIIEDKKLKEIQLKFNTKNKNPDNFNHWFKTLVKNTVTVQGGNTL